MVATVRIGLKPPIVSASIFAVTTTTTYAQLLNIAISEQSSADRAQLAALPVTVAAYTGQQHLSNQKADAQLSAAVSASLALGYRHVVFSYASPAKQPAANPSANAFDRMKGVELPDRETVAEGAELSFDKALYNWLVDMCDADRLGVHHDEKAECTKLLKTVRDSLQVSRPVGQSVGWSLSP